MKWADASEEVREQALMLSGRRADGSPATGNRNISFFLCGEADAPSRLCVWRAEPFTEPEHRAIFDAASIPLPLNHKDDPWTLNLVPLDKLVAAPPGLDTTTHCEWKSLTHYVPPRHVHGRAGKLKRGCSVAEQLSEELASRGLDITVLSVAFVESGWVKVHRLRSSNIGQTKNDKLGYTAQFKLSKPVRGPISLGHSCHFGLGLFVPAD